MQAPAFIKQHQRAEKEHVSSQPVDLPDDIWKMIGYEPNEWQQHIHDHERRFNHIVCHRRFGKTVSRIGKLIERAIECPYPNGRYAYLAPTYSQAEDIAWTYLEEYADRIPNARVEKSRLSIHVPSRIGSTSRIRLYGVDSPKQRLRGAYLDGVVRDESPWMPRTLFPQVIRPMLSDTQRSGNDRLGRRNQWSDSIFTPYGRDHIHKEFSEAQAHFEGRGVLRKRDGKEQRIVRDNRFAICLPVTTTKLIPADELEDIMMEDGRSSFEREFLCSFDAEIEGAIFGKEMQWLREQGRIRAVEPVRGVPVHTAWDLGWDDDTVIVFFQILGAGTIHVIDVYWERNQSLAHYAAKMAELGYLYGHNLLPHDVEVHDIGTAMSRKAILRDLGIRVTTVPRPAAKNDALAATQSWLPFMHFDEVKCERLVDALTLYQRKQNDKLGTQSKSPHHDWTSHFADAMSSLSMGLQLIGHDKRNALEFQDFATAVMH